jgi:hypothetical protein
LVQGANVAVGFGGAAEPVEAVFGARSTGRLTPQSLAVPSLSTSTQTRRSTTLVR